MVSFECFTSRSGVLSMLQCESLAAAARMLCIEGGRHSRHRGAREAGKRRRVARAGPVRVCSRRWRGHCRRHGRPDTTGPSGR
jgi:hypothetical protein